MWTRVKPGGPGSLEMLAAAEPGFGVSAFGEVVEVVEVVETGELSGAYADVEVPSTTGVAESAGGVDDYVVSVGVVEAVLASRVSERLCK